jgi:hypothetical protein
MALASRPKSSGALPLLLLVALAVPLALTGCRKEGCLGGEEGCRVPTPCPEVEFTCAPGEDATVELRELPAGELRPGGLNAHGARGDFLLGNSRTVAVVAAIGAPGTGAAAQGHQTYLDPNGGALIDLGTRGGNDDSLNQMLTVTGILPGDAVRYTSAELLQACAGGQGACKALQLRGHLEGNPAVKVATRYEVRACEPGVRVRTELVNGSPDPQLYALSDGFYWSGREAYPFTPGEGSGFRHAGFDLLSINGVFRDFPYLTAHGWSQPAASYALTSCTKKSLRGFNSTLISGVGLGQQVVEPRDALVYERFLAVQRGDDVAAAADVALEVRRQLWDEEYVTLSGQVVGGGRALGTEGVAALLISEGAASTPAERRAPWTHVVPDAEGRWSARVPKGRDWFVELRSFGRTVAEASLSDVEADATVAALALPGSARVTLQVRDGGGAPLEALVLVVAADADTAATARGDLYVESGACAPWLGPPQGGSPACNRVLVSGGATPLDLPLGRYLLYATKGPFWTVARAEVDLRQPPAGALPVPLTLTRLPQLQPAGTVGADLHVHGAASFDSSIPEVDRVRSFAAMDLDVIAATDHEVVFSYENMVRQLGYEGRMSTIPGVETTGHVLWLQVPGSSIPKVVGHYNFWPLPYDPTQRRNGAPLDEFKEPGELFADVKARATSEPVFQLNHPWAEAEFGRDLGFPRALGMDMRKELPEGDNGTPEGMYVRTPAGAGFRNSDHHAQEVMNGTDNGYVQPYRAFWFYVLNQGHLRAGTANSDTHSLVDSTVGLPRNVVYAATRPGPTFSVETFNAAVRAGRVLGTNGPVVEAAVVDPATGGRFDYGLTPFRFTAGMQLDVRVTAAPWVPVEEVRVIVNGRETRVNATPLPAPADPFGTDGTVRYQGRVDLGPLLPPGNKDAWVVVEAGARIPLAGDLGGGEGGAPDGIPDTSDNNGDGKVDRADVSPATATFGPLLNVSLPESPNDPARIFGTVVTGGFSMGFTNPFFLLRDGNATFDKPGVGGGF